jgi:hypothetical protein
MPEEIILLRNVNVFGGQMLDQIINKALIFRRGCRALVCRLFFFTYVSAHCR